MAFHRNETDDNIHVFNARTFANIAARDAETVFSADVLNVNKLVRVDSPLKLDWLSSTGVYTPLAIVGVLSWTDLIQTPGSISANLVVQGNAAGTALEPGQDLRPAGKPTFDDLMLSGSLIGGGTNGLLDIRGAQGGAFGGDVRIQGGFGLTTSGKVNITAGATNSIGSDVTIRGGDGPTGQSGGVNILGGVSGDDDGAGGNVFLQGGQGGVNTGKGGDITITSGASEGLSEPTGAINISAGQSIGGGPVGDLTLQSNGGLVNVAGGLVVAGDLTVQGTTTTLESTTLLVEDKNIELGVVATPTDITADGGGITLKGTTDKTINWINATDAWTFNQKIDALSNDIVTLGNIGLGTSAPNPAAILDVTSTTKGILFPRMTALERDDIPTPPEGLVLFDTNDKKLNLFKDSEWRGILTTPANTLAIGSLVFATGSHELDDDPSELHWDNATKRLLIGATSGFGKLHVEESTAGTAANLVVRHADGTNSNSHASVQLVTIDATGGDPSIIFSISNIGDWSMGIDNSDGDKFKIATLSFLGNAANDRFTIERTGKVILEDQIQIKGGIPGLDKVLTSDANGLATWETPTASGWVDSGSLVSLVNATDKVHIQGLITIGVNTIPSVFTSNNSKVLDALTIYTEDSIVGVDKAPELLIHNDTQTTGNNGLIAFSSENTTLSNVVYAGIAGISGARNASFFPGELAFYTRANNSNTLTERMRIDEDGNRGLGTSSPNSTDHVEGSVAKSITTKTAAYTASNDYTILIDAISGAVPITLPTAVGIKGRIYIIKKIDSSLNAVTIDADGTETIDESLTQSLSDQNEAITIQSDNANWAII